MKKYLRIIPIVLLLFITRFPVFADEGMWLPQLLQVLNEKEMKKLGMKISAADIYSNSKGSLKDAIVSIGGCTAEIISDKGLILTNHHCGLGAIRRNSTLQNNHLSNGFWAKSFSQEIANTSINATFIVSIEEVTDVVKQNLTSGMNEKERQSSIDKNIAEIRATKIKESYQEILIRPFFEGNKYYMFITETYRDVRLVGAPPAVMGAFGADTDNWMWPRHAADFALFRIYAGKDNKPAAYSPDNIPYTPKRSLNISLDGVTENDFTMVFGFPGRTSEYLHSSAVSMIMNVNDPAKVGIRDKALKVMKGYMKSDPQIKLQYTSKYSSMENSYKRWKGEMLGLKTKDAVNRKKIFEAEFQKRVSANADWNARYGTLLSDLEKTYSEFEPYSFTRDYYTEVTAPIELFAALNHLDNVLAAFEERGQTGFDKQRETTAAALQNFFKDYNVNVDQKLFETLIEMYIRDQQKENVSLYLQQLLAENGNDYGKLTQSVYGKSRFTSNEGMKALLALSPSELSAIVENDIAYKLLMDIKANYTVKASKHVNELQTKVNELQRVYMQAQMEVFPEKKFYPDANGTMRVTYGKVKGYKPRDAIAFSYYTYLDGVMEKYIPGDYEFDVPEKLIELYNKKDYGPYGVNGKMPVNFIGSNHTTGGNSGSPALDAYGNLVGLNFDRVWEGTMSDYNYDPDICRNIMVDIRYVLFIIDKLGGAKNLISELKIVHPKRKK